MVELEKTQILLEGGKRQPWGCDEEL